jgi:S-DNA-T family DNA segregation ATPase FtsK/SpoIIIE
VHVRLDGRATVGSLRRDLDVVRAHLRIASTRRTEVTAHPRGGWATLTVRTRDAVDTRAARWSTGAAGLGVDVDTGRTVPLPLDARILIGGASGAGKSWALRPLMARALAEGHRVTILDGKGEEGSLWARTGATVATAAVEVSAALASAGAEMDARGAELSATGATAWRGRLLILAVDEGRVLLGTATPGDLEVLTRIATMGRSRGVVLWWATQHPTVSGRDRGLTAQLAAVMDTRICLRVRSRAHARTVLDDAVDHSPAHEIHRERPGLAYLTGAGTDRQVQIWGMSDDDVRGLRPRADPFAPERATEVAGYVAGSPKDPDTSLCVEPAVTQRAGSPPDPDIARASAPPVWMLRDGGTAADDVLSALASATTPLRQAEIARVTGRPSGTVSRTVRALADSGRIVVGNDGSVQISR